MGGDGERLAIISVKPFIGVLIERLNIIVRYGKTRPAFAKKVVFDRHPYRYYHGETMKALPKNNCALCSFNISFDVRFD